MQPNVYDEMEMDEAFDLSDRLAEMHSEDVKMWSKFFVEIAKLIATACGAKMSGGGEVGR